MRKTYVYRLKVEYPEGIGWLNPPEAWEEKMAEVEWNGDPDTDDSFRWPSVTQYLSRSGAKSRADLLIEYGCKVEIQRSNPVVFEEEEDSQWQ